MQNILVTGYGNMVVPNDIYVPDPKLMPLSFDKWYKHQTQRAQHAFRVGRALPHCNDGGW